VDKAGALEARDVSEEAAVATIIALRTLALSLLTMTPKRKQPDNQMAPAVIMEVEMDADSAEGLMDPRIRLDS
jgi:hypothetical protein